ncbi:MAG: response regulator [Elusimicrobiota bacterium]
MATRILVVDDEEDYRIISKDILKSAGMEVNAAEDGAAALSLLENFIPDIILLDWNMPKMDGEAFCRKMRGDKRFAAIPVIMLTVKGGADSELEAMHFGVDDFLLKPFDAKELLARVNAILRRLRAH